MSADLALLKKDVVDVVAAKVKQYSESNELHLPQDYSVENAMKSAWLTLQSTKDKNDKLALEVCTKDSIANALLDMAIQGLNPAKKQCYFVVYGNKLNLTRSYFGTMAVARMAVGAKEIDPQVVYKGDEFEYSIERGRKRITKHIQKLENISPENIIAAYCVVTFDDGRPDYAEIMTFDQIQKAWLQGINYKIGGNGVHQKFSEEMAKKTVVNRTCKAYINSSNDNALLMHHFNRTEEAMAEMSVDAEIAENANGETIDIQGGAVEDTTEKTEQETLNLENTGTEDTPY